MTKKTTKVNELLEEAIENIRNDRASARVLLSTVLKVITMDSDKNEKYGFIAAKYLETSQRSNEQLVKIAELMRKKNNASSEDLDNEDIEDVYEKLESGE